MWVKMTVNRRLAKSHGYYLQHAKEVCLVGKKGKDPPGMKVRVFPIRQTCTHAIIMEGSTQPSQDKHIVKVPSDLSVDWSWCCGNGQVSYGPCQSVLNEIRMGDKCA